MSICGSPQGKDGATGAFWSSQSSERTQWIHTPVVRTSAPPCDSPPSLADDLTAMPVSCLAIKQTRKGLSNVPVTCIATDAIRTAWVMLSPNIECPARSIPG